MYGELFPDPQPDHVKVSRAEAIAIARRECKRRRLPFEEPLVVHAGWFSWSVRTLAYRREGGVHVVVSQRNGRVCRVHRT